MKKFYFHPLFSCIQQGLCDDNRIKLSLNPFSASSASEDILKLLISSAKNAKCPGERNICCAIEFTKEVSVDCIMSEWSTCSQTCGPGTQIRTILISAKNGGKECPGFLKRACNKRNCPGKRLNLKTFGFLTALFCCNQLNSDFGGYCVSACYLLFPDP